MSRMLSAWILAASAVLSAGAPARAADLDSFYGQPDEDAPPPDLTFGTGWYLRGDLTATDDRRPDVLGTLDRSNTGRDWTYGVGGGAGYAFTSHIRGDVTADYFGAQKAAFDVGGGTLAVASDLRRYDVLANGYFDLGTWAGFTPYVGAGIGVGAVRLDGSYALDGPGAGGASTRVSGPTRYDLAWAAMAGVSYSLSANLLVDIGYRYLDLGTYRAPRAAASAVNEGLKADLASHQVRVGLRYMIY